MHDQARDQFMISHVISERSAMGSVHDLVTKPPLKQETWVQFLSQEDPLQKEMATCSSILAWRILWTEEPGGLSPMGLQKSRT